MTHSRMLSLANLFFRVSGLVLKFALSICMGRYLSLTDIGTYGLIFALVMFAVAILGFRMDYTVSRRLAVATPLAATVGMRDQAVVYAVTSAFFTLIAVIYWIIHPSSLSFSYVVVTVFLSVIESVGNLLYINVTVMGRPTLANFMFFVRSALWVPIVIGVWFIDKHSRTVEVILYGWSAGAGLSIFGNLFYLARLPWTDTRRIPINWRDISADIKKCLPIWVGGIGLIGGAYVDRFVVAHFLGLQAAGVSSFYFSFVYSLLALVQTGVLAISYPKMLRLSAEHKADEFWKETVAAGRSVALFSILLSTGMGVSMVYIGRFTGHRDFVSSLPVLWLMLFGIIIRCNSETVYYILYARQQDRPIWLGNLFYLVVSCGLNFALVPLCGLYGIGVSSIISAIFLMSWRAWFVVFPEITVTIPAPRLSLMPHNS